MDRHLGHDGIKMEVCEEVPQGEADRYGTGRGPLSVMCKEKRFWRTRR